MRSVALLLILAAALAGAAASTQGPGTPCPFFSAATTDVGAGSGVIGPTSLSLTFNPPSCALDTHLTAVSCCNSYFQGHFLLAGVALWPAPLALPSPFVPGSELWLWPVALAGPIDGHDAQILLPADSSLIGATAWFQAVSIYFTTIGFTTDYATSQAVSFTLN